MTPPFFTIGHSNRGIEPFVALLREAQVAVLVDIRKITMSRANPQFNEDRLAASMTAAAIAYERLAALGGRRGRAPRAEPGVNGLWTNQSFHNYADYALSEAFHAGFQRLLAIGRERRCAIMCAEAVWWRCHRRIVADYLIASGEQVFHIMGAGRIEPARLTPGAIVQPSGIVVYPET